MINNASKRTGFYLSVLSSALRTSAYPTLFEFLMYRLPFKAFWARLRGYRFHRSSLLWYREDAKVHTRVAIMLERVKAEFPTMKAEDIEFELFHEDGRRAGRMQMRNVPMSAYVTIESKDILKDFGVQPPFTGTLLIKHRFHLDDEVVWRRQRSLFNSSHTHIDYYSEGSFITTLHDYSAFLPDQGINPVTLGMIPAYCDDRHETFLLFHSAKAGIGAKDMRIRLFNDEGRELNAWLPAMKPFCLRRIPVSELFGDVRGFLGDQIGQIVIEGFLRQMLRRTAYGVQNRGSEVFSLDHCFYSDYDKVSMPRSELKAKSKGAFSPFLVLENEHASSAAILYQSSDEAKAKSIGVLLYDEDGKLVASAPSQTLLCGNTVRKIEMRPILEREGVSFPFVGHAELVLEPDASSEEYETNFEHAIVYDVDGKLAHVLHGSDFWNSPQGDKLNPNYRSGNRVVCNDAQTTYIAINNCSHAHDYAHSAHFTLRLIGAGVKEQSAKLSLKPHGTLYRAIDDIFPDALRMLSKSGGVGIVLTTDIDCKYLTHAFLTVDRRSGALSVEHSISCAVHT